MAARYANDVEIAKAQRDFELKKAHYDQEIQTKKAESDMAYELQVKTFLYSRVWVRECMWARRVESPTYIFIIIDCWPIYMLIV